MRQTAVLYHWMHLVRIIASALCFAIATLLGSDLAVWAEAPQTSTPWEQESLRKKINFISTHDRRHTPNPVGWEEYDGSLYTKERGYGWLTDLSNSGWDSGGVREIILPDGKRASPIELNRMELANGHASHSGNLPVVFRIDLADGWYRVNCSSVYPSNNPLPLVDERSIKFRAHDVVFAGPRYGAPLKIEGNRLVEGSGVVEVTEGHLRLVMGDPAYGGWTWTYPGPFWRGWRRWWKHPVVFANGWYQKISRTVDPGFHGFRLNSLEIERVPTPAKKTTLIFRDFFNRDDSPDINSGVAAADRWVNAKLHPTLPDHIQTELYKTSLKLTAPKEGKGVVGVVQKKTSPENGIIRYSTSVSLFTGEGSKIHNGFQEAGLLILGEATHPTDFNSTFIGVAFDRGRPDTPGWVRYRVGNGQNGYRTSSEIPNTSLPFTVTEGEYEIIIDHDVRNNILQRIQINGKNITELFTPGNRKQRVSRGLFGIRAYMDSLGSGVRLQQFYWYYRVEDLSSITESLSKS
jgi:hypothetical protein